MAGFKGVKKNIIKTLSLTISALPYPKDIYSLAEFYQKASLENRKTATDMHRYLCNNIDTPEAWKPAP